MVFTTGPNPVSPNPLSPTHYPLIEEKFHKLADSIFQHCDEALNDGVTPYDVPHYPIAENQQKVEYQRQMSL